MKWFLALAVALCASLPQVALAEITTTFESYGLAPGTYDNNPAPDATFNIDGHQFSSNFFSDPIYGDYWSGWAISNVANSTSKDFTNQYAAFPGAGAGGSATYAVAFTGDNAQPNSGYVNSSFINLLPGLNPLSIDVANTTYAALTMEEGDAYGFTGPFTAGDFLKLDITGYDDLNGLGGIVNSVEFLLADFTNGNSFILDTWQTLDLSSLLGAKSLRFGLLSTDFGSFGINTPGYLAVDNLRVGSDDVAPVPEPATLLIVSGGLMLGAVRYRRKKCS